MLTPELTPVRRDHACIHPPRPRFESGQEALDGRRQHLVHDPLHESRLHLDAGGHADAATFRRHRDDRPDQTERTEWRLRRGHLDPFGAMQHGLRAELQAKGSESHDLVHVADGVGLTLHDPRGYPPAQEFGIALDVGREIEGLLAV